MERINLFFLHGFLGRPQDWSAVVEGLPSDDHLRCFVPDYFNEVKLSPRNNFDDWASNFNLWVQSCVNSSDRNILVGYSLGGRLAIHALMQNPTLWSKVALVSMNPGLADENSDGSTQSSPREQRLRNDLFWADKFSKNNWDELLKEWNSQSVFAGSLLEPVRLERDYDRALLSAALTEWSLARQRNMVPVLKQHCDKVLWIVGEIDKKYVELTSDLLKEIPALKVTQIPDAAHRVLFDKPQVLQVVIQDLLK